MSSLRIASIVAAFLTLTNGALADPIARGGKARKTHAPTPQAQITDNGYYVPYVTGADGKKYPIMEIPGSVTVISRQVMDDQQAITLGDALRNVSGVTVIGR
jgi:outer membrane receptor for ferric coprogen and ferric-rhodotorulic acid